jgi:16S rRNA (cytidine1402-2'-O)-methyltransferase
MGKLVIVPTPIGNLNDITLRALDILKSSDKVLCEDTRHFSKIQQHFSLKVAVRAYHKFNEHKLADSIVNELSSPNILYALVSDAGTPGISDPAYLLIHKCIDAGIEVECLPGPTAFIPALVESGLPSDSFVFEGFLPHQKGRLKKLNALAEETRTIIFYESPYRLLKTLEQISTIFGPDRKASVSRELTKIYAETKRGTVLELLDYFKTHTIKGEFVIIVHGKK